MIHLVVCIYSESILLFLPACGAASKHVLCELLACMRKVEVISIVWVFHVSCRMVCVCEPPHAPSHNCGARAKPKVISNELELFRNIGLEMLCPYIRVLGCFLQSLSSFEWKQVCPSSAFKTKWKRRIPLQEQRPNSMRQTPIKKFTTTLTVTAVQAGRSMLILRVSG